MCCQVKTMGQQTARCDRQPEHTLKKICVTAFLKSFYNLLYWWRLNNESTQCLTLSPFSSLFYFLSRMQNVYVHIQFTMLCSRETSSLLAEKISHSLFLFCFFQIQRRLLSLYLHLFSISFTCIFFWKKVRSDLINLSSGFVVAQNFCNNFSK